MAKRAASRSRSTAAAANAPMRADMRMVVMIGPEEFIKRRKLDELRQALQQAHGEVDLFRFDGETTTLAQVMDELRTYSLMMSYKLVVVDEAESFVTNHRKTLENYAQNPVEHATLVLRSTGWRAGNLDKLVSKVGTILKCEQPAPSAAINWLIQRAKAEYDRTLRRDAAELLVELQGCDLLRLDSTLARLGLMLEAGGVIERHLVEELVGKASEDQAYAVQEALLQAIASRQPAAAINKIHELVDLSRQADVLVGYFVADLMRKLCVGLMMQRKQRSDADIGRALKLWGPRQALFMRALKRLQGPSARRLFDKALELDRRAKSGFGESLRNLECFCVMLADEIS